MTNISAVVYIVGLALLFSVAGIVYLAASTAGPIPDVLQNIAVGSLAALVAMLVPAKTGA